MADAVEHQATVETGLKMKIKRKNPTAKTLETKCKATEDKNANIKSRKNKPEPAVADDDDTAIHVDEKPKIEVPSVEQVEKPQKRKRNGKSIRQVKTKDGEDYEAEKGNKKKMDCDDGNKSQKEKPKDGKVGSNEKPNRKRVATTCYSMPSTDAAKPKSQRINTNLEKEPNEELNLEAKKPGNTSSAAKNDSDETSRSQQQISTATQHSLNTGVNASVSDPYEFVAKVEDTIQTPIKKFKSEKSDVSCSELLLGGHHDISTETCSIGVTTDPDCLGPCEPGTSVILEGIVWSESNNGILVVNVTWRGKTYVGTLMDATRHHWASPRFREESPVQELDWRSPKAKRGNGDATTPITEVLEGRRLRKCRRNMSAANGCSTGTSSSTSTITSTSTKTSCTVAAAAAAAAAAPPIPLPIETNGRRRGRNNADNPESSAGTLDKKSRHGNDDSFIECTDANCSKKFKHISGLNYHQSHAHRKSTADECKTDLKVIVTHVDHVATKVTMDDDRERKKTESPAEECSDVLLNGSNKNYIVSASEETTFTDYEEVLGKNNSNANEVSEDQSTTSLPAISSKNGSFSISTVLENSSVSGRPVLCSRAKQAMKMENSASVTANQELEKSRAVKTNAATSLSLPLSPGLKLKDDKIAEDRLRNEDRTNMNESKVISLSPVSVSSSKSSDFCHLSTSDENMSKSNNFPVYDNNYSARLEAAPVAVYSIQHRTSSMSGYVGNSDDASPTYSDISDMNDGLAAAAAAAAAATTAGLELASQTKDGEMKKPQRSNESKHKKMKCESSNGITDESNAHSTSLLLPPPPPFHPSPLSPALGQLPFFAPLTESVATSSGLIGNDVIKRRITKTEDVDALNKNETADVTTSQKSIYTKQLMPDERRINRTGFPLSPEAAASAAAAETREHQLWMENLHHRSQFLGASSAMNAISYGYGLEQAYHMQMMSSNPEMRSHYERWLMEQHQYQQQQQQCYNQMMQQQQAENERCSAAGDMKPVDMSSKGPTPHHYDSNSLLSSSSTSYAKVKANSIKQENKYTENKSQSKSSSSGADNNNDWSNKRRDSSQNGFVDVRKSMLSSTERNSSSSSSKASSARHEQQASRNKDAWDTKHQSSSSSSSSSVSGNKMSSRSQHETGSPSLNNTASKSKSSNLVNSLPTYPLNNINNNGTQGFLKSFVQQQIPQDVVSHLPSGIGSYNSPASSYLDSTASSSSLSPNSKFLDLDSKQVIMGSRGTEVRHPLDALKYQSSMYTKPGLEHSSSIKQKHERTSSSSSSKEFSLSSSDKELSSRTSSMDVNSDFTNKGSPRGGDGSSALSSGHSSPLTLRHLHTHHHTHVVGAAYPIYGSYNGLVSPVPTIVPPVPPVIPTSFISK